MGREDIGDDRPTRQVRENEGGDHMLLVGGTVADSRAAHRPLSHMSMILPRDLRGSDVAKSPFATAADDRAI